MTTDHVLLLENIMVKLGELDRAKAAGDLDAVQRLVGEIDWRVLYEEFEPVVGKYKFIVRKYAAKAIHCLLKPYHVRPHAFTVDHCKHMLAGMITDSPSLLLTADAQVSDAWDTVILRAQNRASPVRDLAPIRTLEQLYRALDEKYDACQALELQDGGHAAYCGGKRVPIGLAKMTLRPPLTLEEARAVSAAWNRFDETYGTFDGVVPVEPVETGSAHITPVDGNAFLDLGFPPEEADRLKVEADMDIDRERSILSVVTVNWQKLAMVLLKAAENAGLPMNQLTDELLAPFAQQISHLVEVGKLESQGNLALWRNSEVRLPGALTLASKELALTDAEHAAVAALVTGFTDIRYDDEHQTLCCNVDYSKPLTSGQTVSVDIWRDQDGRLLQASSSVPQGWREGDCFTITAPKPVLPGSNDD